MKAKIIILLFAVSMVCELPAQSFKWGLRFDTKFDNHERGPLRHLGTVKSGTYFSVRLAPQVGIGWGERGNHSIMAGGSFTLDMGAKIDYKNMVLLLYYNYDSPQYGIYAGKFERRHLIGAYSRAIYSGVSTFYDNVVDGFALQYHPENGYMEVVLDWDGLQSPTMRESFRGLISGEYNIPLHPVDWLSTGFSFDMYHLASRTGLSDGVVDHLAFSPWVGARFEKFAPWFERLTLQVGWLEMFDRERAGTNRWLMRGGATIDVDIRKWRVGIRNRFYVGQVQMPLWAAYGNRIYKGDPFYAGTPFYNYTQIYWNPRIGRGVLLDLEVGLHTDGKKLGLQQVVWIGVTFDNSFFKKKKE